MPTSIKLDKALNKRVHDLANHRQRSAHWIMFRAIEDYVDRQKLREQFMQEAIVSWTAYKETGKHLTGQEVREWLGTWGADNEKPIPECHE